jgi:hypothetical protein
LAAVGDWINATDAIMSRQLPITVHKDVETRQWVENQYRDASATWKGTQGEPCVVDRVLLTANDEYTMIVKVRMPVILRAS